MIVSKLISGALRKLGALATGATLDPAEAGDALETLRNMYLQMVGDGTFGRQADISVPDGTGAFTASEGRRYSVEQLRNIAITLPEVVTDTWWRLAPYGEHWTPPGVTTEPHAESRPPLDGALVTASDLSSTETRTYVYDAAVGRWTSLQDLKFADEAPLSTRYAEGLMCELALRLAPEYGQEPSIAIVRGAAKGQSAMVNRFDGPARVQHGTFY